MASAGRMFRIRSCQPATYHDRAQVLPVQKLIRWQSSMGISAPGKNSQTLVEKATVGQKRNNATLLSPLSTSNLLRSLCLAWIFSTPAIFKPSMAIMKRIANSESIVLDPDKNPFLRALVKPFVYDHFCAGTNKDEVRKSIAEIKAMGFTGVALCHGKEILIKNTSEKVAIQESGSNLAKMHIDEWREGHLKTLELTGKGDFIGMKFTGAGPFVTKALATDRDPPEQLYNAMEDICRQARIQGARLWIDAEQQVLQGAIDRWTIDLMRRHNRNGEALVLTTIQAYLKSSRENVARHLQLAHREGWTFGIKLVRGAYIASEERALIHNTKRETDESYNSIAEDLIMKRWPGFDNTNFPSVRIFLAGHNLDSVERISSLATNLIMEGKQSNVLGFAQLKGMADDVSCKLLEAKRECEDNSGVSGVEAQVKTQSAPSAYKCLTWGSVKECMQYLLRRATENEGAADRMRDGIIEIKKELRRRIVG